MPSRFQPHASALAFLTLLCACGSNADPCTGAACGDAGADPLVVTTSSGPISGKLTGATRAFLGVPYAAPPVGDLRWKPPAPHPAWASTREATAKGPGCRQHSLTTGEIDPSTSEDCLTLDVWTPASPASPAAPPLPVLVWIHGGSFTNGSGGAIDFDGRKLSEATGAVVVTLNYRLGPIGFLAYAPFASEDPGHPSTGLFGFEDQRAAIAWVKSNAAAFGGDPARVTLFGESAGAISVCWHLVSPKSRGLFEGAMIESGACAVELSPKPAQAKAQADALASALGCSDAACLRSKSADAVLDALPERTDAITSAGASWFPAYDGWNLPSAASTLISQGSFAHVPLLLGTNGDEGSIFFLGSSSPKIGSEADFTALMEARSPGHGAAIVAQYPASAYGSAKSAAIAAVSDGVFVCPARRLARAYAKAGLATHLYHFTHVTAAGLGVGLGAYHGSEIGFVFGNATMVSNDALTPPEKTLSAAMMGYWGRMGASGDPNGAGATPWPAYDATKDQELKLDVPIAAEAALRKAQCDFWDGVPL